MRLAAQSPVLEAGRLLLPSAAPWPNAYKRELLRFPSAEHDDQVDATSQTLDHMENLSRYPVSSMSNDDFQKRYANR